jgi:erythromycin esterase-like protein
MLGSVYQSDDTMASTVRARLVDQFDALVHFDETRCLEPMDPSGRM